MSTPPPNMPPFDPTNRNDPRYDPRLDPANDPRWQRQQTKAWERNAKAEADALRDRQRFASRQQRDFLRAQARQQRDTLRAYKRSTTAPSLVGPLLLIAFAVLALLLHNGRITWPLLFAWYSRWWPVLLIGLGLLRLAEWGVDRAFRRPGQPAVRYNLGGGVVTLIILLTVAGIATQGGIHVQGNEWNLGLNGNNWNQFLGSKHEQDTPAATHAIAASGALAIDDPRGDVTVTGTSDDGLIHLSVHTEVFTSSDADAQTRLAALEPQFSGSGDNLTLRVNGHENDDADLTLLVPPGVRVSVNANRGDVKVSNFKAAATVTANRGDVDVAAVTGPVSVHVNSRNKSVLAHSIAGSVEVQGTGDEIHLTDINGPVRVGGDFFGGGNLQHISGPIDYSTTRITFNVASLEGEVSFDDHDEFSARDADGPFTLRTRSRDLTLTRLSGAINVTNSHGKVDLSAIPPGGTITVDNHDGDIRLSLPQQAKFTLAAETSDGDVSSNFSVSGGNNSRGTLNGTIAGGGNAVRLTTTHGDIAVDHTGDTTYRAPKVPSVPMKFGFGSVPAPPPLPGALSVPTPPVPPYAMTEQTKEQIREAQESAREAMQQGEEARRDALQQSAEARREAHQQAEEARREARQQAAEARQEAEQARREAQQEAAEARREAQQQRDEARRQAHSSPE